MAGFPKASPYFVPRCLLPLQKPVQWYCEKLLPNLVDWRMQATSCTGDKSTLCDTFLVHIVPYFVEVLVQDGVFFIRDFPAHPMSQYLKVIILVVSTVFSVHIGLTHFATLLGYCRTKFLGTSAGQLPVVGGLRRKRKHVVKTR